MGDISSEFTSVERLIARVVEGSPLLVAFMMMALILVWRTWRLERVELLHALEEERQARKEEQREMLAATNRAIDASLQVKDALNELRRVLSPR